MDWMKKLWRKAAIEPAEVFLMEILKPEHGAPASRPLRADEDYVSVVIKSLYVPFRRLNVTAFHGTVMSELSLAHSGAGEASFHVVTSPSLLRSSDATHLSQVIQIDLVLLDQVPYRGGRVAVELGLFAEKSADLARPLVDVISTVAGAAGVAFVGAAQPFIGPLRHALDVLTGVPNAFTLLVGIHGALPSATGYIAAIAASRSTVDICNLKLHPDRHTLLRLDGTDFTDTAYMILSIEATQTKGDWARIPELLAANQRVKHALTDTLAGKNRKTATTDAMSNFRVVTLTSSDLLFEDAEAIVRKAEGRMERIVGDGVAKIAADADEWPDDLRLL